MHLLAWSHSLDCQAANEEEIAQVQAPLHRIAIKLYRYFALPGRNGSVVLTYWQNKTSKAAATQATKQKQHNPISIFLGAPASLRNDEKDETTLCPIVESPVPSGLEASFSGAALAGLIVTGTEVPVFGAVLRRLLPASSSDSLSTYRASILGAPAHDSP
eukprot:CAMPEP_0184298942 /NCGR_PEP_ID=MMETSP1049-20130417/9655_1 /TAXON_ID=77928 /ORGANISM="Proteomonas sulcata, Strain CCMP704" /LENGTH=159 /DNA_ID=CAMNT_0026609229 /DNA_START=423 /DNA_END=902 /DNA_ORIENTATION=-